jgi:hypothetical protein
VHIARRLDMGLLKASFEHPRLALSARVLKAAARLDEHVEARQQPMRRHAPSLLAPPLLVRVIVGAPNENGGSAARLHHGSRNVRWRYGGLARSAAGRRSCDGDRRTKAVHALPRLLPGGGVFTSPSVERRKSCSRPHTGLANAIDRTLLDTP